ncbi:MAG: polysaccharide pyruvyl transferase family protein [Oscillospiraceae bacterium]
MDIYILTWYEGSNYGSVLQAYALRRAICSLGYNCRILNYHPGTAAGIKQKLANKSLMDSVRYKINERAMKLSGERNGSPETADSMSLIDEFRQANMQTTERCSDKDSIMRVCGENAVFVCGSDQIWNPYFYDPFYFLEFVNDSRKKIAYAPSFGVDRIPKSKREKLKNALSSFEFLSVREESGRQIVKSLTGKCAEVVVDPTMLIPMEHWNSIAAKINLDEPYLFCYFLSNNNDYFQTAREIAKKFNLKIMTLPMTSSDFSRPDTIKQAVGPKEVLALIKNASFVLTDSFHCCAFAIRCHRQFYVFRRFSSGDERGQDGRTEHLLGLSSLEDRLISSGSESGYSTIMEERFEKTDLKLRQETLRSAAWLENAMSQVAK